MKKHSMYVNGTKVNIVGDVANEEAFISLTDIAKYKNPDDPRIVISNWMSSYATIDFLAMWEQLYNPGFNRMEFQTVRGESGRLIMTPSQWIERMNAIGITSKAGRYGGTYAHSDIAFEFASWVSLEFKLYLIKDYQRLKKDESERLKLGWDAKRELSRTWRAESIQAIRCDHQYDLRCLYSADLYGNHGKDNRGEYGS